MKLGYSILAILFIFHVIHGEDSKTTSDVQILTDSNFASSIAQGDWLVEFYAPWCGHCKHLAPTYEKVATTLKGRVNVAKVDCTSEAETGKNNDIKGYPTIKFFKDGKAYNYQGDRTHDSFVQFAEAGYANLATESVQKKDNAAASDSDVVILTEANFDALTSKGDWLLEFYAPWCGHCKHLAPIYEKVATGLKGKVNVGKIDCTKEGALQKRFGIRGYPTIKFLKDGKTRDYRGERTVEEFVKFVSGGYTSVDAVAVPEKGSVSAGGDDMFEDLKFIEKILKDKIWVALGSVFIFGLILGKLLFGMSEPQYVYVNRPQQNPSAVPHSQITEADKED